MIKEEEPPKPSTRLSDSGEALASISAQRHMEPGKLTKLVRGELDWIVMKTLEKDRNRRYETANGLAADVQRYLSDEPVQACPPTAGYRFKKMMRRHKGPVLAAALVLVALVVGVIGLGWGLVQADRGRRLAEHREQEAHAAAVAEAKAKQEALEQQAKAEAAAAAERQATLAAQKAEQAARESEADTKAYSEFLVNDVLSIARPAGERGGLGIDVTVRKALEAAQEKISATFQDRPRAEAVARHDLGATFRLIGELKQAEPHLRRAVALRKQVLGHDHEDTLVSQNSLAVLLVALGKREEALPLYVETLKLRKAKLGPDHIHTLQSMSNLGHFYWSAGQRDLALPLFEETLKLQQATLGPDHRDTLTTMNNVASSYPAEKRDQALLLYQETLKLRQAKLGPDHPDTLTTMSNLAGCYSNLGKPDLALPLFKEALKLRRAKQGPDHPDTLTSINNLAFGYWRAEKLDLALPLFKEALKLRQAKLGPDHPDTLVTMNNLASGYRDSGRLDLALPLFQQAAAGIEKLQFMDQHAESTIKNLIACHERLKQYDQAETWLRKWLAVVKPRLGAGSAAYAGELWSLGMNLLVQKKYADAEPILRECLTICEKKQPDAWTTFNTKSLLGGALLGQKKYAEAEPLLRTGYEGLKERAANFPPEGKVRVTEAIQRLIDLYTAWDKPDQAAEWRKKLDALKQ
jgi:eukaryotic-like serine/threonine-protein kinase